MTPYKQIVMHNPDNGVYGDCWRTCIGCILDLHPTQVPHFVQMANDAGEKNNESKLAGKYAKEWLAERGLELVEITLHAASKVHAATMFGNAVYILSGQSPNYDCCHSTIGRGALEVIWDPSPSGKGLKGPYRHKADNEDYYFVELLVPLPKYLPNHKGETL